MHALKEYISRRIFDRDVSHHTNLFNQYSDVNPIYDRPDAHIIRRNNLITYISQLRLPIKVMFIGIAPGYAGCRFTGIPFTSEDSLLGNGRVSFFTDDYEQASKSSPRWEQSSTNVWKSLERVSTHQKRHLFMWNVVPFHPFGGTPLSNRDPIQDEVDEYSEMCRDIVNLLKPQRLAAFGRIPHKQLLKTLGTDIQYIKHPSRASYTELHAAYQTLFV